MLSKNLGIFAAQRFLVQKKGLNQWKSRLQQQRMEYHDNLHIRPENLFFWLQEFPLISCVVIVISIAPWSCSSDPRKNFLWNAPHPCPFSFPFPIFLICFHVLIAQIMNSCFHEFSFHINCNKSSWINRIPRPWRHYTILGWLSFDYQALVCFDTQIMFPFIYLLWLPHHW